MKPKQTARDCLREKGLTINFARLLIAELGGDSKAIEDDWCWKGFVEHYVKLKLKVVKWFIEALKDKDVYVRGCAASMLGKIGSVEAMPTLIAALKDEDAAVRRAAAWALGMIGSVDAVPALIAALKDEKAAVRKAAAWALGMIGSDKAVPALIEALKHKNEYVRKTVAWALGKIEKG